MEKLSRPTKRFSGMTQQFFLRLASSVFINKVTDTVKVPTGIELISEEWAGE